VVGSRAVEVNGTTVYRDVTAEEYRSAQPGEVVELPQSEIARLMELGFVQPIDGNPAAGLKVKAVRPKTGIDDDPRIAAAR
jgi:hypothetical protein